MAAASAASEERALLGTAVTLPCGVEVKNRLAKAATTECLADPATCLPNEKHCALYRAVAEGGVGMIITGNVQVDGRYLEAPGNVVADAAWHASNGSERMRGAAALLPSFEAFAAACRGDRGDVLGVAQLSHPGRQCPSSVTRDTLAPSAVPLHVGGLWKPANALLANAPTPMKEEDIQGVIERFASAAALCKAAGFGGVELHAAHGYLLSQFLSPKVNQREDDWGGTPEKRRRLLLEVVRAVRAAVGDRFVVGVKINSADFQRGGFGEDECIDVVQALEAASVDFVEISGGTYESMEAMKNPDMSASTRAREGFFLPFARRVRAHTKLPLMLTGGMRSLSGMAAAVREDGVDFCGLARPVCADPGFPGALLRGDVDAAAAYKISVGFNDKLFVPILSGLWHRHQMELVAAGKRPNLRQGYFWMLTIVFARSYVWEPRRSWFAKALLRRGVEPSHVIGGVLALLAALWLRRRMG